MTEEDIFLDKIKIGMSIVEKELNLITQYQYLIKEIRLNPEIRSQLNEYDLYPTVWENLAELYDFLSNDYIKKLSKEEAQKIKSIMARYDSFTPVNLPELKAAYKIVLKIMSLTKFHDIIRKLPAKLGGLEEHKKRLGLA